MPSIRQLNTGLRLTLSALALTGLIAVSDARADTSPLTASPTSSDFGNDDVHSGGGPQQTIKFTNETGFDVNVSSIDVTGADPGDFVLNGNSCSGAFLSPSASCSVDVTFSATATGPRAATLTLTDDFGTLDVALTGTGITGTLSAGTVGFNPQPWFYGGQQQNLNLQSSNDAGVQITSATITGPDAAHFYIAYGQNCASQQLGPGTGCGMGIGFDPGGGPGTFHAALEVAGDSAGGTVVVPLDAVALAGPHVKLSPGDLSFGSVALGQDAARVVTVTNDGDAQLQVQQALVVTGTPAVFPITSDGCSGQTIDPGSSCAFTLHFQPHGAGTKEASIFLISSTNSPVTPIGITGTGVETPDGGATITGTRAAGSRLTCTPLGYPDGTSFAYSWLRNGRPVAGVAGASLELTSRDVGSGFACRVLATNAVGSQSATSPQTAAVAPMDLSRQTGAFTAANVCREIHLGGPLQLAGHAVRVPSGRTATPWAPLTLTDRVSRRVSIDGRRVGNGRTVSVSPRSLSDFSDGAHTLRVEGSGSSAHTQLLLSPCRLAARVSGGPGQSTSLWASSRAGMRSLTFRLPRGLSVRAARHRVLGTIGFRAAGYPAASYDLVGPRTSANDVVVALGAHFVRVTNLPDQVGIVRVTLRPGVVFGRGGVVDLSASVQGSRRALRAGTPAAWLR